MKKITKLFAVLLVSGFAVGGFSQTYAGVANDKTTPQQMHLTKPVSQITAANCNGSSGEVLVRYSNAPGHEFIICNNQIVVENQSSSEIAPPTGNQANQQNPPSPWASYNSGSHVCRGALQECEVFFTK